MFDEKPHGIAEALAMGIPVIDYADILAKTRDLHLVCKIVILNNDSECWLFVGSRNSPFQYGQIVRRGPNISRGVRAKCKKFYAHSLLYRAFIGEIPPFYDIHHTCKNRICCNPAHLGAKPRDFHRSGALKDYWRSRVTMMERNENGKITNQIYP